MISFPQDSQNTGAELEPIYDRAVDSAKLAEMYKLLFTTGVFADPSTGLQVTTGTGMTVTVKAGNCNIEGYRAIEDTDRTLAVTAPDVTHDRIDRVVARLNLNIAYRDIDLYIVAGTPAGTPVAPALTRTSSVYEIALADLFVTKNATTISSDKITDQRLNSSLCGIVTALPGSIDTETIFDQYQSALTSYLATVESAIDETLYGKLKGLVSLEYNPTLPYALGSYTIYSDVFYKNTTAIGAGGEAWNAAHWIATNLGTEITAINNNLVTASGTWTPTLVSSGGGACNYAVRTGNYYKIGKMVVADFEIVLTGHSLGAGGLGIEGLPFSAVGNNYSVIFSRPEGITLSTSYNYISGYTSGAKITLLQVKGTWDALYVANITTTAKFRGSFTYICD